MARRIDWDKVRRNRKVWFKQPWESHHHFWRGYEFSPRPKKGLKHKPTNPTLVAKPRRNEAILRSEFPEELYLDVPLFSRVKKEGGKDVTPTARYGVRILDYLCPALPADLRARLLGTFKELKNAQDPFAGVVMFEKRLQFLAILESWRYDHDAKHLEVHFVPRKGVYASAAIIWPDIGPKK